ncbi:MAG: penicillin-binding protein 2 [Pseudobdellovibrionaceae bacterium]
MSWLSKNSKKRPGPYSSSSAPTGSAMGADRDADRLRTFTRRAFLIAAGQGALFSILGARMAWLQIAQSEKYTTLSEDNRINISLISPNRGKIVDRYGVPLALNVRDYRVVVIPEKTDNLQKALENLKNYLPISDTRIANVIKQSKKMSRYVPVEIMNNLSWNDVARLEVNRPSLPGIRVEVGEIRHYPLKEPTAHLIGYVGRVNEAELTGAPVELLPGYKIGKTGLEKAYNEQLKGTPGQRDVEVNAAGKEVRDLEVIPAKEGERLTLSIDAELQRYVQGVLAQHASASAVVMDVHDGAVYAMASYPGFDPNLFVDGINSQTWSELLNDPAIPLTNKSVTGQYPPGSTFKMVTALAGLETGVVKPNTYVTCPGHFSLGKARFHCWKHGGHGSVNVVDALAESCDVFFYKTALEIGIDRISAVGQRLGLGHMLNVHLPEEKPGHLPTQEWRKRRFGERWQTGETVVNAIGQGYVLATPLQLATMTARLVNGGKEVNPWVSGFLNNEKQFDTTWPQGSFDPKHLAIIMQGMDEVVNSARGTARGSRIHNEAFAMGGKTGTAQVKRITAAERARGAARRQEDLPWNLRHHALFVGYAPTSAPRYAVSVVVEHGIGGSSAAAPIARDILSEVQRRRIGSTPFKPNGGLADTTTDTFPPKRRG